MSKFGRMAMVAVFAFAGGCAAFAADDTKPNDPTPPANPKIEVARGDRWIYEVRDDITNEIKTINDIAVTDVSDSEIDTRVRFINAATNAETHSVQVYDHDWRLKDNGVFINRPGIEETSIPTEIQVGKTWSYGYEMSRITPPARIKYAGKAKVESWERIASTNGVSYDAFKIVYNSAQTPIVNNRKYETHVELWYAPAINRFVKRVFESRQNGKLSEATVETLRDYRRREK